jgi:ATP-binding cassette subfamily G (WHITE) protein 2 (PDR)
MANILVEIPYQILLGIMVFAAYFYPMPSSERQGLILLLLIQFFVFASSFAHMLIAALPDAETAGNVATLMFSLTLTFNGVFQTPTALPGFWIFMYRVSPLTCKILKSHTFSMVYRADPRRPRLSYSKHRCIRPRSPLRPE